MRLSLSPIVFFCTIIMSQTHFSVDEIVNIITSVQRKYLTGCVNIMASSIPEDNVTTLLKKLSENDVAAAVLLFHKRNLFLHNDTCKQNSPLYVILDDDETSKYFLRQICRETIFTKIRWLLFMAKEVNQYFDGINITIDSEFLVARKLELGERIELSEVYRIHSSWPIKQNYIATWLPRNPINWTTDSFLNRRRDLQGLVLRGTIVSYGFGEKMSTAWQDGKQKEVPWYFADSWLSLQSFLNFTTDLHLPKDEGMGSKNADGTWSGVVGFVHSNKAEFSVVPIACSRPRAEVVDCLVPIVSFIFSVSIRQPDIFSEDWDVILSPFHKILWFAIATNMLVLTFALSATLYIGKNFGYERKVSFYPLLYVFGIFNENVEDVHFRSWATRIVTVTAMLTSVIIYGAYAATIISFLAVHHPVLPFKDFKSLLDHGSFKLGVRDKTSAVDYLRTAEDPLLKAVFKRLMKPMLKNLPCTYQEGYRRLCEVENFAFLAPDVVPVDAPCHVVQAIRASYSLQAANIIRKGSPYRRILNKALLLMKQNGVMKRIKSNYERHEADGQPEFDSISLDNVFACFVILLFGIVISTIILLAECVWKKYHVKEHVINVKCF